MAYSQKIQENKGNEEEEQRLEENWRRSSQEQTTQNTKEIREEKGQRKRRGEIQQRKGKEKQERMEKNLEFIIEKPTEIKESKFASITDNYSPPLKFERKLCKRTILKQSIAKRKRKKGFYRKIRELQEMGELYCRVCGVTESPQWRKGPDKQISMCNACGLHYLANLQQEKLIPPNPNPSPIPISAILNYDNDDNDDDDCDFNINNNTNNNNNNNGVEYSIVSSSSHQCNHK